MIRDKVSEIIPDEDPLFPCVPVEERYSPEFLANCDTVTDNTVVEIGWIKTETGYEPAPEPEPGPVEPGFPVDPPAPNPTYAERVEAMEAAILVLMGGL